MAQMDALALKAAEEVFGHGVVIGIALAGHALPDAETGETLTVKMCIRDSKRIRLVMVARKCMKRESGENPGQLTLL